MSVRGAWCVSERPWNFDEYRRHQEFAESFVTRYGRSAERVLPSDCGCGAWIVFTDRPCPVCGMQVRDMIENSFDWNTRRCGEMAELCERRADSDETQARFQDAYRRRAELLRQAEAVRVEAPETAKAPY